MRISQMQEKLGSIDVWELMIPIIESTSDSIIEKNRDQLSRGEKANGEKTPTYSPKYLKYKQSKGSYKASPNADLYATGSFYKNFYVKPNSEGVDAGSTDDKESMLEDYAGKKLFWLNKKSLKEMKPVWSELLVKSIRNKLK